MVCPGCGSEDMFAVAGCLQEMECYECEVVSKNPDADCHCEKCCWCGRREMMGD